MRCSGLLSALCFGAALALAAGPVRGAEPAAKSLFGAKSKPAPLSARAIGTYNRGCLAGAAMLPVNGPAWQAMRLSRNRNWGHPVMVRYVERLAVDAKEKDRWPGLMVGDLAQPRGGPMLSGHASHQIGLDADIWLNPMPDHTLSPKEREEISAVSMIKDNFSINPDVWTSAHVQLLKRAVSYKEVERIFVHPAIKKALCEAAGDDRDWLRRIRPWWGHHYHFHVRIACPPGSTNCKEQAPPPAGDGCGKALDYWFAKFRRPPPPKPKTPPKPRPELTMANLPGECRTVLEVEPGGTVAATLVSGSDTKEKLPWLAGNPAAVAAKPVPLPIRKPAR